MQSLSEVAVKPRHAHVAVAVWCMAFFALLPALCAQETTTPKRTGYPQDWSQRHIIFSRDGLAQHPNLIYREPRVLQQALQRWQVPNFGSFESANPLQVRVGETRSQRDWNQTVAGHVPANTFPAKFSFFPDAPPNCNTDYVVFGLTSSGTTSGGKPNLVAFNNLYVDGAGTGFCSGTAPSVLFAYNITTVGTNGHIITSPILSLDGTKIGFVESIPANGVGTTASAIFHVLTWTAGQGTLILGAIPTSMTSLTLSTTSGVTRSSPWIDYATDTVYVGVNNGNVYQITGVFNGTPTLSGSPWPVSVNAAAFHLSSPVLDGVRGLLMVGSANGNLYQIDTTSGGVVALGVGGVGTNPGIVAAPIVDVANGTTFVVTANDGISAALVQVNTATMVQAAKAEIGLGAHGGTALNLYEPAVSNGYFTDPSTGVIRICGTGALDTSPWQYAFGFTGTTMHNINVTGFPQPLLTDGTTAARCTGWTEFFNPNVGGGTDFFFFGLTQDCTILGGGAADGCVAEVTGNGTTPTIATVPGGPSGIVIDNFSTDAQASNIYFTAVTSSTAYKFTQNGLQ
jgi:hypothetical protein